MKHLTASYYKKTFHFKVPSGTSRGVLSEKHAWFIEVWDPAKPEIKGIGECSIIPGLSPDFDSFVQYEEKLKEVCNDLESDLTHYPSIHFGLETALLDLSNGGVGIYFKNDFSAGKQRIPINGLIWMGDLAFMQEQVAAKIKAGFKTIKMKVGAINFDEELTVLKRIREKNTSKDITLRVDANGAFSPQNAMIHLKQLAALDLHSIEQPIKQGQMDAMAELCANTPLPIALDEELIGIHSYDEKRELLKTIMPQFIILKPSLHGGISGCKEWIELAEENNIAWWMTSALESNIGLNAICQFTAEYSNELPQGLGTGSLYTDNIPSKLSVQEGYIRLEL